MVECWLPYAQEAGFCGVGIMGRVVLGFWWTRLGQTVLRTIGSKEW